MEEKEALSHLRSPRTVREQSKVLYDLAAAGRLNKLQLDLSRLPATADYVIDVIKERYPTLSIPYHSRWRHFNAGGVNRLAELDKLLQNTDPEEVARIKVELVIISVLLDAGAGMRWRYKDESGKEYSKSEGLAIATYDMFCAGLFSSDPDLPLRADITGLKYIKKNELSQGFQASASNPLVGLDGRFALLQKLAQVIERNKKVFGETEPRLGNLFDYLLTLSGNAKLPARKILTTILEALGPIWPGRTLFAGTNLGDVFPHSLLSKEAPSYGLVPFHKLSQWLTYSLLEPLEDFGILVSAVEELTGLPEYRNGGLFIDMGVINFKDAADRDKIHKPDDELVIEWRALTIILLDEVAQLIRQRLGKTAEELPLASILEGGTWAAGRKIALSLREDGGPPVRIASDGTVF